MGRATGFEPVPSVWKTVMLAVNTKPAYYIVAELSSAASASA